MSGAQAKSPRQNAGTNWMRIGLLLLAAALLLTCYNIWDEWRADRAAELAVQQLSDLQQEDRLVPDYLLNPDMEMPVQIIDGEAYIGTLYVPALDLSLPVISEWSYPRLKKAPCRYKGSAYKDDFIIAGHNYRTHFGELKNLQLGDRIAFTDNDNNQFLYQIVEMEVLDRTAVKEMEAGDWDLTLFTCTVGGASRVTIRCQRVN